MKLKQIIIVLDWYFYQRKKKIKNEFREVITLFLFAKEHEAMNIHKTRFVES